MNRTENIIFLPVRNSCYSGLFTTLAKKNKSYIFVLKCWSFNLEFDDYHVNSFP